MPLPPRPPPPPMHAHVHGGREEGQLLEIELKTMWWIVYLCTESPDLLDYQSGGEPVQAEDASLWNLA